MTFALPSTTVRVRAREAASAPLPYLLKGPGDDDSAWNLVAQTPVATSMPGLSELISVTFIDGSVRVLEPDDVVLLGSVAQRGDDDRQELRDLAGAHGWRRIDDGADLFVRGSIRIEVHYRGATAFTARRLREERPTSYYTSAGAAKSAAAEWLATDATQFPD